MTRWRIAIVFEVDAETLDEAHEVGDALCNAIAEDVAGETFDGCWADPMDAKVWGVDLGKVEA